jgi:hypothetical protein
LKPLQAVVNDAGDSVTMVSVGGSWSILQALAGAKSAEIEFGGKRYELSDVALANCRELLKRSEKLMATQ